MIDFNKRLEKLKDRRQGTKERAIFDSAYSNEYKNLAINSGFDLRKSETYESLKETPAIKYTIGAMAAVDSKSTIVSINEGERVADSLIKSLENKGESVTKKLQGSVALDIHIKGHSDVDMLIIVINPVSVETPEVYPNTYIPSTDPRNLLDIAKDIRNKSEDILPINFPSATVDCSGNKSIGLEGGSLKRKVDIVPAIWFDSINYQRSGLESDRGVKIYHKSDHALLLNYPFLHIKLIDERDRLYSGNLKRVIRLMKNLIADMPDDKKRAAKKLSSYDLAAIGYHMASNLNVMQYMHLSLVDHLKTHLNTLWLYDAYRNSLYVPDGTRKIFDTDEKEKALHILKNEVSDLALAISKELNPLFDTYDSNALTSKHIYLPVD